MEKESFVLYSRYLENIEILSMEQRGVLFTAILRYVSDQSIPDMDGTTKMAFSFIRSQIDRDAEKYNQIRAKRSEGGKNGGRPRKSEENPEEPEAPSSPKKPRKAPNKFHNFPQRDTDYDNIVNQINGF